jgi:hypothetical protein
MALNREEFTPFHKGKEEAENSPPEQRLDDLIRKFTEVRWTTGYAASSNKVETIRFRRGFYGQNNTVLRKEGDRNRNFRSKGPSSPAGRKGCFRSKPVATAAQEKDES